jgi:hypothetical protein
MSRTSWLGFFALIGYGVFLLLIIVLHTRSAGYSPLSQTLSEYALEPFGQLMTLAFLTLAGSTLALALALTLHPHPRSPAAIIFLVILAVGVLLAGIFPTDPADGPRTSVGLVHDIASMVGLLCGMAAMVLFTSKMEKDAVWRAIYRPASILALAAPIAFLLWVLVFGPLNLEGLGQRIFVATLPAWLVLVAAFLWLKTGQSRKNNLVSRGASPREIDE